MKSLKLRKFFIGVEPQWIQLFRKTYCIYTNFILEGEAEIWLQENL